MSKSLRRHVRIEFHGYARLAWQDAGGAPKYGRGRCLDLSASGLLLELPETIPLRTYVSVRVDEYSLSTSASVRHSARKAGKFLIGLEFSCPIKRLAEKLSAENTKSRVPEPIQQP